MAEYNNPQTFLRLTGLAFFQPVGQAGYIDLGNIVMLKVDYNLKSADDFASVRGNLSLRRRQYYGAMPVYTIEGNQFVTPNIPLMILGDQSDDFVQGAATGNTFTFTAAAGLAFVIPAYGLTSVVVKVGVVTKTINTDYLLDTYNGIIWIPVSPVGIAPGDVVVVTYNQPAFIMDQYQAFTHMDRLGQLIVFSEDDQGPPSAEVWIMSVSLSCKKGPDTDPSAFRKFTLEAAILGNPIVRRRSAGDVLNLGVGGDTFSWS